MFLKHDTTTMLKSLHWCYYREEVHRKKKIKTCITLTGTKGQNKQNSIRNFSPHKLTIEEFGQSGYFLFKFMVA